MTALAGWVSDRNTVEPEHACSTMLRALEDYSCREAVVAVSGIAALGAALFPTLPEDEFDVQPIATGDKLLIADIRLDNRLDLLEALGTESSEARGLADSAILARAWLKWGEDSLQRIVGDFAIAIYDGATRKLTLARDPTGQRPLFYAENAGGIAFASMPSGLLALECNRRGFDYQVLAQVLSDVRPQPEASYFNGVHRVPAGHVLTWTNGAIASHRYWQPSRTPLILNRQSAAQEYGSETADVRNGRHAAQSRGERAIDVRLDRVAEIGRRTDFPEQPPVLKEELQVPERIESGPVHVDRKTPHVEHRHARLPRGVDRRDDHRLETRAAERGHKADAEIDDVPRAIARKDHGSESEGHSAAEKLESRDGDVERATIGVDHAIAAAHCATGRVERTTRHVVEAGGRRD